MSCRVTFLVPGFSRGAPRGRFQAAFGISSPGRAAGTRMRTSADSKQHGILDLSMELSRKRSCRIVHLSIQQSNVGELCYKIDILSKLAGSDGAPKRPVHNPAR